MMKQKRKIISLLLVICLMAGLLPVGAFATVKAAGADIDIPLTWKDRGEILTGPDFPPTAEYGERITLPSYSKDGYLFLGWKVIEHGGDYGDYVTYRDSGDEIYVEFPMTLIAQTARAFSGSGTQEDPYQIADIDDLESLSSFVRFYRSACNSPDVYYILTNDIDLSSVCSETQGSWTPIGDTDYFAAHFNGNHKTISNLYFNIATYAYGLFGALSKGDEITNLTVTGKVYFDTHEGMPNAIGYRYAGDNEENHNDTSQVQLVPYGYTSNGVMAYRECRSGHHDEDDNGISYYDIKGIYNGSWVKTTYADEGYEVKTEGLRDASVVGNAAFINGGRYVKVAYTVTAGDTAVENGKLGIYADTMIADNDKASVEVIKEGDAVIGLKMVDTHPDDKESCHYQNAQFNLYFKDAYGVTDADTYWFGYYSYNDDNVFNQLTADTMTKSGEYNEDYETAGFTSYSNGDSGMAFSWQNINLAAGESKTFSFIVGIGKKAGVPKFDPADPLAFDISSYESTKKVHVTAKVTDSAGQTDSLYYDVNGGAEVLLGSVLADGTQKIISQDIDLSSLSDGVYTFHFWLLNDSGVASGIVERRMVISSSPVVLGTSNQFAVTYNANGYGTVPTPEFVNSGDLLTKPADPTANGCIFGGWYTNAACSDSKKWNFDQPVTEDIVLWAKWTRILDVMTQIGDVADQTYTGSEIKPSVTITDGDKALVENKDYTLAYSDNINVGTAAITITGIGDYTGSATKTFRILKAAPSVTAPTAKENLIYNGSKQALINAGSATAGTIQYSLDNTNWSTGISEATNAGTYTVYYKVVGNSNYQDVAAQSITVSISKKELTVAANNKTITYGDAPANNGVSYTGFAGSDDQSVLGGTLSYDYSYSQYGNVGSYTITPKGLTGDNYSFRYSNGTLTVEKKEIGIRWAATESLIYTGSSLVPNATATGLVHNDTCILTTAAQETVGGAGVIPGKWTAKVTALSNSNYKLPATVTTSFTVINASQNAPEVSAVNETVDGRADGKITGVDSTMEYRKESESDYTAITGTEVTGLADGTYYVRYKAKPYYDASGDTKVTISAGRKLTVTVPASQTGYTLTVDKANLSWNGSVVISFALADEYSKTDAFAVKVNGLAVTLDARDKYTVSGVQSDVTITVEGVADITAPTAEITIGTNKWNSFLNTITFGLFFKETQSVTVTAADAGSGVDKITYYLASAEMTEDEVKRITDWTEYTTAISINPDNKHIVYVKAIDKAGNVVYVNSDGLVLDAIAPVITGVENNGVYYGDTEIAVNDALAGVNEVKLNGTAVALTNGKFTVTADNAQHTVSATDNAGNAVTYTITVYRYYTVTYVADGKTVNTFTVGCGRNVEAVPDIPAKAGYDDTAPTWDKNGENITEDTVINAVYIKNNPGEIEHTTDHENNFMSGDVQDADADVFDKVLTEEDKEWIDLGEDIDIYLEVWDISDTVSAEDKAKVQAVLGKASVGLFVDVSLFKQIGAAEPQKIAETKGEITVSIKIPDTLINKDGKITRVYQIVRVHEGAATVIDGSFDEKTGIFTFKTDKFSTYSIIYTDTAIPENNSPQTGDSSNIVLWEGLLISSLFILIILGKKRKFLFISNDGELKK